MDDVWLLLALGAVLLYGTSQVGQKLALNDIPASVIVFLSIVISTPISIVCLTPYIVSGDILDYDLTVLLIGILAGTFGQMGYYIYLEAAQRGPISIVGSITAAYPIMVVAVAILFLSEAPGELQLFGALLVTASMITLSYLHGGSSARSHLSGRYFLMCIASMLLYGFWAILTKLALDEIPSLLFLGLYAFVVPPTVYAYNKYKGIKLRHSVSSWSVPFMIAIMASEIGNIGFLFEIYAISDGPASIVFPLIASYPVVVVVLAYAFLKERLTKIETLLIGAVVLGIILIATV